MIYVVTAFLWISTCLYLILGGADFGAGIVELFSKKDFKERTRNIMYNSIGPIWEANHMWLIMIKNQNQQILVNKNLYLGGIYENCKIFN